MKENFPFCINPGTVAKRKNMKGNGYLLSSALPDGICIIFA